MLKTNKGKKPEQRKKR